MKDSIGLNHIDFGFACLLLLYQGSMVKISTTVFNLGDGTDYAYELHKHVLEVKLNF